MSSDPSQSLHDLARAMGIATDFWDWQGQHTVVSAESIRTVLAALDVDASTEEATQQALADRELATWRRALPPTVVAREGWTPWVPVHIPHGQWVELEIELEDGSRRQASQVDRWVEPRPIDGMHIGEATFEACPVTCPVAGTPSSPAPRAPRSRRRPSSSPRSGSTSPSPWGSARPPV